MADSVGRPAEAAALLGRAAIVTGASRGIGLASVVALCREGASVLMVSRRQQHLDQAREVVLSRCPGAHVDVLAGNVGDEEHPARCVSRALSSFGSVDILVNNAGANPHHGPLMEIGREQVDKTLATNLVAPLVWTQRVWAGHMREHGGSIVNIVSIGAVTTDPGIGFYNVTKAALVHLTHQLAAELAPKVRVNAVAPGLVKTAFAKAIWDGKEAQLARRIPLGRLGEPNDVGSCVAFLAGPAASYVTGHMFTVDGGMLVRHDGDGQ
jgi:NAD(P)-dependent dehydrogenase (short-subunit alcohol dehydrogenase family)